MFPPEEGFEGNRGSPLVKGGGTPMVSHIIRFALASHMSTFLEKLCHRRLGW